MNNSVFRLEEDQKPDLSEREGKLATLIEAAEWLLIQKEWSTLQNEEFQGALERYERQLLVEAQKPEINEKEIYRLQGRIEAMKRYDLAHMRDKWRMELDGIRKINSPGRAG